LGGKEGGGHSKVMKEGKGGGTQSAGCEEGDEQKNLTLGRTQKSAMYRGEGGSCLAGGGGAVKPQLISAQSKTGRRGGDKSVIKRLRVPNRGGGSGGGETENQNRKRQSTERAILSRKLEKGGQKKRGELGRFSSTPEEPWNLQRGGGGLLLQGNGGCGITRKSQNFHGESQKKGNEGGGEVT